LRKLYDSAKQKRHFIILFQLISDQHSAVRPSSRPFSWKIITVYM